MTGGPEHPAPSGEATVGWEAAPAEILARVGAKRRERGGLVIVGITGPVGAGKTTLARALGGVVVSTDSYLPDYDRVEYGRRDLPEVADLAGLAQALESFRSDGRASIPVWSFHSHRRESHREVAAGDLVVVEGIHALHSLPLAHMDLGVYVEAPASVRWARWAVIESTGVRGWGVEAAREFFDRVAEPTFERHARAYRSRAQLVVINSHGVPAASNPA